MCQCGLLYVIWSAMPAARRPHAYLVYLGHDSLFLGLFLYGLFSRFVDISEEPVLVALMTKTSLMLTT